MGDTIIDLTNICFGYPEEELILNDLCLKISKQDKIGLIGPNGCGKTTLFHIIMGLIKPLSGTIKIFDKQVIKEKDFRQVRQKLGLLFQDSDDQLFCPTVIEDVAFGPLNLGKSYSQAQNIAKETLSFLGLKGFENKISYKLSGGEKRMVSLATILAMNPEMLLLDEPTAGLDESTKSRIQTILCKLDISYIIISHEIDFLIQTTNSIKSIKNGKIVSDDYLHIHQHIHAHAHGSDPHEHN